MKAALNQRFATYWDDMEKCRSAGAYWSLLHVTVCLPDICAALQSPKGKTTGDLYKAWCNTFAADPFLTGEERWHMRNRLLHQGRARSGAVGRYRGFAFGSPSAGHVEHKKVERSVLILDVGELAQEMRGAVNGWIEWLTSHGSPEATNVAKNLPSIVQVSRVAIRAPGLGSFINARTN